MKIEEIIDVLLAQPRAIALLRKDPKFKNLSVEDIRATAHQALAEIAEKEDGTEKAKALTEVIEEVATAFFNLGARSVAGHPETPRLSTTGDRAATQGFSVQNILTTHCGTVLTPSRIDCIVKELAEEMQNGPTAWAFGGVANAGN